MSTTPRSALLAILDSVGDGATWEDLKALVASIHVPSAATEEVTVGAQERERKRLRVRIVPLATVGPLLALASIYFVTQSKMVALVIYGFWCLVPPAWFFLEWVWLFDGKDDPARLTEYKTTTELAQKFWTAVLALLGIEILALYTVNINI